MALAGLNLAIGLKCDQPLRVVEPPEVPPLATSLADCLQTAIQERREFYVVQRTVEIAVQGGRVARAEFAPKVVADGTLFNFQQQTAERPRRFAAGVHPARLDALRGRSEDRRDPRGGLAGTPGHGPGRVDRG